MKFKSTWFTLFITICLLFLFPSNVKSDSITLIWNQNGDPYNSDHAHVLGLTGSASGSGQGIELNYLNSGVGDYVWYAFFNPGNNSYEFFLNYDYSISSGGTTIWDSITVFETNSTDWEVGSEVASSDDPGCGVLGLNKACDTLKINDLPFGLYYLRLQSDSRTFDGEDNNMRLTWDYPSIGAEPQN